MVSVSSFVMAVAALDVVRKGFVIGGNHMLHSLLRNRLMRLFMVVVLRLTVTVVILAMDRHRVSGHHERIKDQIKVLVKDVIKTRGEVFTEVVQVFVQAFHWLLCLSMSAVVVSVGGHG